MNRRLSRRPLVLGLSSLSAAFVAGAVWIGRRSWLPAANDATPLEAALAARLNALLVPSRDLAALGAIPRGERDGSHSVGGVLGELYPQQALETVLRSSDAALEQGLRSALEADFEAGRVANVSGWFLSRTEALLCRLAFLSSRE